MCLFIGTYSSVNRKEWEQAGLHVLHNVSEVTPFVDIHLNELRVNNPKKGRNEKWLQEEHNRLFQNWLGKRLFKEAGHSSTLSKLSSGPSSMVTRYTAWSVNGFTFYTRERDNKHPVQNSGVTQVLNININIK